MMKSIVSARDDRATLRDNSRCVKVSQSCLLNHSDDTPHYSSLSKRSRSRVSLRSTVLSNVTWTLLKTFESQSTEAPSALSLQSDVNIRHIVTR